MLRKCLVIVSLSLSIQASADQMNSIMTMLNSFGNTCSIHGRQSQRLLDTAQSLSYALESMLKDEACSPLAAYASQTQSALDRLTTWAPRYSYEEMQFQRLKSKRSALVTAIPLETDPDVRSNLEEKLRTVEIDLSAAQKDYDLQKVNDKNRQLYDATNSYRVATDGLLKHLVENEACMMKHPGLAETAGNVALSLAQSATLGFATSGASLLAGTGLNTLSRIAEFAQEKSNAKKIRKISDPFIASALSCAYENLNDIYCESEKIETLGRFVLSPEFSVHRKDPNLAPFAGLDLLAKALPSLDLSLLLMKIGNDPSSATDGNNRKTLQEQLKALQGNKGVLVGYLADLKKSVDSLSDALTPDERSKQIFRLQKSFILNFMCAAEVYDEVGANGTSTTCYSTSAPSSYGLPAIYSGQKARYYLFGFDPGKVNGSDVSHISFSKLEHPSMYAGASKNPWRDYAGPKTTFIEDINLFEKAILDRFDLWYSEALGDLDSKSKLVFKTDKKEIIASFDRAISKDNKLTPIMAIEKLSQYLRSQNNQKYLGSKDRKIAFEVAEVLDSIVAKLNTLSFDKPDADFQKDAIDVFTDIIKTTKYDEDSRYLVSRVNILINEVIKESSLELYRSGKTEMIYALASADTAKELQSYAGHEASTADVVYDAVKTKGQAIPLIASFSDAFMEPLKKSLTELSKPENLSRRAVERGHLCLQLLGLEIKDKDLGKFILKNCEGATLPKITGIPDSPVFTKELWNQKVEKRICTHQNWRRKLILFESGLD